MVMPHLARTLNAALVGHHWYESQVRRRVIRRGHSLREWSRAHSLCRLGWSV